MRTKRAQCDRKKTKRGSNSEEHGVEFTMMRSNPRPA
jgi:hypothetical protein